MNKKSDNSIDILHVYPQFNSHDTLKVKGTREGLLLLQRAINSLISSAGRPEGVTSKFTTYTADGEGFEVVLEMLPQNAFDDEFLPYVDTIDGGCSQCNSKFSGDEQMGTDETGEF